MMRGVQPLTSTLEDFELADFMASAAATAQELVEAAELRGDRALAVAAFAASESIYELMDVLAERQRRQAA
ncbi:hypothetical protein [Methylorubrum extorquens]